MQVTTKSLSETSTKLTVNAKADDLKIIKEHVIAKLAPQVKVAGFREGKVPKELAEKHLDPAQVQSDVIDHAVNHFYFDALAQNDVKAVGQPKIEVTKFVPFTELEFTAEVEVIGNIKLPDYKSLKVVKSEPKVTSADIKEVLERLQNQLAEYKEVDRAAKSGDRVTIEFDGKDEKGQPVNGAKGKSYPLNLGSNTFIPGFEENIIGLKKGAKKSFTIPFPKDYQVKALQGKKVTFDVLAEKVEEATKQEMDDAFAAKIGPFKSVDELKADITKQLKIERENQVKREFEDAIIKALIDKSKVKLPQSLLDEQINAVDQEFRQNLTYRGQTFNEYLEMVGLSEDEYRTKELQPAAEERLKAGLVLSEIAALEHIRVTAEEVEIRIQILKGQYKDESMQKELDKPEARRDINNRLLTEKTIAKLVGYTNKK